MLTALREAARRATSRLRSAVRRPTVRPAGSPAGAATSPQPARTVLPDFVGPVAVSYAPSLDGDADPGEIVWTWVPYEEDPSRGKDRPVLVVGRDSGAVLALMLTSKDHDRDAAAQARRGRYWLDIGSGPWDARRRPSEVRLDRVLRIDPRGIRREGCVVDRALFEQVASALAEVRPAGRAGRG